MKKSRFNLKSGVNRYPRSLFCCCCCLFLEQFRKLGPYIKKCEAYSNVPFPFHIRKYSNDTDSNYSNNPELSSSSYSSWIYGLVHSRPKKQVNASMALKHYDLDVNFQHWKSLNFSPPEAWRTHWDFWDLPTLASFLGLITTHCRPLSGSVEHSSGQ